jgi:cephalosporin-C deacetylase
MIAILAPFLLQAAQVNLSVIPDHASAIYKKGETITWQIPQNPDLTGTYTFEIRKNNFTPIANGSFLPSEGPSTIQVQAEEPAMLFLQISDPTGKKLFDYAAAVDPLAINHGIGKPKDFDAFWRRKLALTQHFNVNRVNTKIAIDKPGIDYGTFKMDHPMGGHITGQQVRPDDGKKHPALLMLQWAGGPYSLDRTWIQWYAESGWIAMNIQAHDVEPIAPAEYYQNLPTELKNYTSINQTDPETNYFVRMYLSGYVALNQLAKDPQWDGKTLLVIGTSMGGQQAIALAGLHPKVTHLIANVPAGSDLNASLYNRQLGYPNFPLDNDKAANTAQYIDCNNFAPNIRATSLIGLGFVDTVCPPYGIWTTFNRIRGPKEVAPMPDSPHNHLATPAQQQPFNQRSSEWLTALAKGEPIKPRSLAEVLQHNYPAK